MQQAKRLYRCWEEFTEQETFTQTNTWEYSREGEAGAFPAGGDIPAAHGDGASSKGKGKGKTKSKAKQDPGPGNEKEKAKAKTTDQLSNTVLGLVPNLLLLVI